jgi:hypothetical protein
MTLVWKISSFTAIYDLNYENANCNPDNHDAGMRDG